MNDKKTVLTLSGIMFGTILLIAAFAALASRPPKPVNVELGSAHVFGPKDAKVTVVEFSDFECPGCETFATGVLPELKKLYADKVRFAYKFFPLYEIHQLANLAAQSAWCSGTVDIASKNNNSTASAQGATETKAENFWKYHDILMSRADEWKNKPQKFNDYAKELGLNPDEFKKCQNSDQAQTAVLDDRKQGESLGVNSTPSFFVNGEPFIGLQTLDNWKKIIDAKLIK